MLITSVTLSLPSSFFLLHFSDISHLIYFIITGLMLQNRVQKAKFGSQYIGSSVCHPPSRMSITYELWVVWKFYIQTATNDEKLWFLFSVFIADPMVCTHIHFVAQGRVSLFLMAEWIISFPPHTYQHLLWSFGWWVFRLGWNETALLIFLSLIASDPVEINL